MFGFEVLCFSFRPEVSPNVCLVFPNEKINWSLPYRLESNTMRTYRLIILKLFQDQNRIHKLLLWQKKGHLLSKIFSEAVISRCKWALQGFNSLPGWILLIISPYTDLRVGCYLEAICQGIQYQIFLLCCTSGKFSILTILKENWIFYSINSFKKKKKKRQGCSCLPCKVSAPTKSSCSFPDNYFPR